VRLDGDDSHDDLGDDLDDAGGDDPARANRASSSPSADRDPVVDHDLAGDDNDSRPAIGANRDGAGSARDAANQRSRSQDRIQPEPVRRRLGERGWV
jgi:hypothetical protein